MKHYICKDQIWVPRPKDEWTQAQQAQNNEFVESELKNWTKMIWITNKVGLNDNNRKIYWFKVKKIVLGIVQGDQFLYISCKFDYNFGSWLLQCFFLDLHPFLSVPPSPFILPSPFIFTLHVQARCWCWYLSHQHLLEVYM